MTQIDLDAIRRAYPPADGRTHWQGCELSHPLCAVAVLVAEVERLRLENEALRDGIGHANDRLLALWERLGEEGADADEVRHIRAHLSGTLMEDGEPPIEQVRAELAALGIDTTEAVQRVRAALEQKGGAT